CNDDRLCVRIEEATSSSASICKAKAVCTQGDVSTRDVWANLLMQVRNEIGYANERTIDGFQLLGDKWLRWLYAVLQSFLTQALAFARQFNPRGNREEVGLNSVVLVQDLLRTQRLVNADAGGQDISLEIAITYRVELVDAAVQTFNVQVLWLSGLVYWLVVHGEVVHDIFAILTVHAVNTTGDQVCNFETESRVIL